MTITSAEQAAWQSGTQKNLTLAFNINGTAKTLNNSSIVSESMSLRQTVSDDASNVFGNVYASEFNIRVFDDGTRYKGATLTVTISVTLENVDGYLVDSNGNKIIDSNGNYLIVNTDEDVTYTRQLGVFEVISDKLTSDGITRDLVCYDKLSAILAKDYANWHNGLTYPLTIRSYRNAFLAHVGLSYEVATLPNDTIAINKNEVTSVSGAMILSSILGLNACWGYIGIDNIFHYALPKTTADYTITDNSFIQGSYAFEEFQTAEYSGIIFTNSITTTVTDGDESHEESSEQNVTVGDATGSVLNFQDNILLKGKTDAELTTIGNHLLTALDGFIYTPSTVTFPAYIGLELGDVFQITTSKGTYSFPVLDRKMSGITALKDTFSAEGVEYSAENANSLQTFMARYQASMSDVSALLNKTSEIASNASQIAGNTNQYFWHTETGTDTGAHITEIPKEDFLENPESGGGNLLARSNGIAIRNGLTDLATFGQQVLIGEVVDGKFNTLIDSNGYQIRNGTSAAFQVLADNTAHEVWTLTVQQATPTDPDADTDTVYTQYDGYVTSVDSIVITYGSNTKITMSANQTIDIVRQDGVRIAQVTTSFSNGRFQMTLVLDGESAVDYQISSYSINASVVYKASSKAGSQIRTGLYPSSPENYLLVVGNGTPSLAKNAFSVSHDGSAFVENKLTIGDQTIDSGSDGLYLNDMLYGENVVLWSGGWYMTENHTAVLAENISAQPHGIVLAWSAYVNGAEQNYDWIYYFIPKWHVLSANGTGVAIPMCTTDATTTSSGTGNGTKWGCKYIRVYNGQIVGYKGNNTGNTGYWVLRRVIGV